MCLHLLFSQSGSRYPQEPRAQPGKIKARHSKALPKAYQTYKKRKVGTLNNIILSYVNIFLSDNGRGGGGGGGGVCSEQ